MDKNRRKLHKRVERFFPRRAVYNAKDNNYSCPYCNKVVRPNYPRLSAYCPQCGQMIDWRERKDIHVGDVFLTDDPNHRTAMVVTMVNHEFDKVYLLFGDGSIGPTFKADVLQYKKLRRPCRHIKKALKMIRKVEEKENALR